jgi:hypothetical protein
MGYSMKNHKNKSNWRYLYNSFSHNFFYIALLIFGNETLKMLTFQDTFVVVAYKHQIKKNILFAKF